jgi:hypothetical protein
MLRNVPTQLANAMKGGMSSAELRTLVDEAAVVSVLSS